MNAFIDTKTASMDQLDALSIDDLLGNNIGEYSLSSNLGDGLYMFYIEKFEVNKLAADIEKDKKASISVNLTLNVVLAHTLADPNEDKDALVGRKHFERFNVLSDFGSAGLIKLLLGIVGVSYKDKKAIAELNQSPIALLNELVQHKVAFGATVKTVEKNGYENCNIVLKEKNFVDMNRAVEFING